MIGCAQGQGQACSKIRHSQICCSCDSGSDQNCDFCTGRIPFPGNAATKLMLRRRPIFKSVVMTYNAFYVKNHCMVIKISHQNSVLQITSGVWGQTAPKGAQRLLRAKRLSATLLAR